MPKQNVIAADESNHRTPSSTDEAASRLAGFGKISGNKNSLDRKTNLPPEPRTSEGTTTEDTTVEVSIDDL